MKCQKCENETFTITVKQNCDSCEYNGWRSESSDDYKYGHLPEGIYRDEAYEEGECQIGTCYNFGCWLIKCTGCGQLIHNPQIEAY